MSDVRLRVCFFFPNASIYFRGSAHGLVQTATIGRFSSINSFYRIFSVSVPIKQHVTTVNLLKTQAFMWTALDMAKIPHSWQFLLNFMTPSVLWTKINFISLLFLGALKDAYRQGICVVGCFSSRLSSVCTFTPGPHDILTITFYFCWNSVSHAYVQCSFLSTVWEVTLNGDSLKGNSLDHFVQHLFVSHGNCGLEDKQWDWLSTKYYIITEWAAFSLKLLDIRASSFPQALLLLEECHLLFTHWTSIWDSTLFYQCMFLFIFVWVIHMCF